MSYHRKRHASMMESQKKAAEAAQSMLAAASVTSDHAEEPVISSFNVQSSSSIPIVNSTSPSRAPASASVQHEDFNDESSDDSESGIAFLQASVEGKKARKEKVSKNGTSVASSNGRSGNKDAAAAAAAVMSLQRMHWTKEMVSVSFFGVCCRV